MVRKLGFHVASNLNAVFALSPTSIWAAGDYNNGSPDQTLIEYCG